MHGVDGVHEQWLTPNERMCGPEGLLTQPLGDLDRLTGGVDG